MKIFGKELTFNGFDIFHKGNKPTKADVGLSNVDNVQQFSISNPPGDAYIAWGGKSIQNGNSPIDASLESSLGANRFALIKNSAGVDVEYSRDGGKTWHDYQASEKQKLEIFTDSGTGDLTCGKPSTTDEVTTEYMLRITIDMNECSIYTYLNKLVLNITTSGSSYCYCTIECSSNKTPDVFERLVGKSGISGWSGYNVFNFNGRKFGSTSDSYGKLRLTFGHDGSHNPNYYGLSIIKISAFGGFGWKAPSELAKTGHLYKYDFQGNAMFPAAVTAKTFIGDASTVSGGYTVKTNVPTGAKFTDTIYTHPAFTAKSSGLYKITVNTQGHVTTATAVTKSDITALGIPAQDTNTTYSRFTSNANGLVPASGGGTAKFLRADGTWQVPPSGGSGNKVTVSTSQPSAPKVGDIWI